MTELLTITPTAAGVRVVHNGMEIIKPMTAKQLCHMASAFMAAAADRMGQGEPGSWQTEESQ